MPPFQETGRDNVDEIVKLLPYFRMYGEGFLNIITSLVLHY